MIYDRDCSWNRQRRTFFFFVFVFLLLLGDVPTFVPRSNNAIIINAEICLPNISFEDIYACLCIKFEIFSVHGILLSAIKMAETVDLIHEIPLKKSLIVSSKKLTPFYFLFKKFYHWSSFWNIYIFVWSKLIFLCILRDKWNTCKLPLLKWSLL